MRAVLGGDLERVSALPGRHWGALVGVQALVEHHHGPTTGLSYRPLGVVVVAAERRGEALAVHVDERGTVAVILRQQREYAGHPHVRGPADEMTVEPVHARRHRRSGGEGGPQTI